MHVPTKETSLNISPLIIDVWLTHVFKQSKYIVCAASSWLKGRTIPIISLCNRDTEVVLVWNPTLNDNDIMKHKANRRNVLDSYFSNLEWFINECKRFLKWDHRDRVESNKIFFYYYILKLCMKSLFLIDIFVYWNVWNEK